MSSRRGLLRCLGGRPLTRRPSWTAADFAKDCTGCTACVEACLEGVLRLGISRFVEFGLSSVDCTLYGECASRCEAGLFDGARPASPWVAMIGEAYLVLVGIHCRSCQDACEPAATHFRLAPGGVALAELDSQRCSGCGVCLVPCPSQAIQLRALSAKESPRHI